jgi:hypothetical protein
MSFGEVTPSSQSHKRRPHEVSTTLRQRVGENWDTTGFSRVVLQL